MKNLFLSFITISILFSPLVAKNAKILLKENGCMRCHNIMGMKLAPPFAGIARMNSGWFGVSKNIIKDSIKNGSKGRYPMFSNTKMPAFRNLNNEELNILTNWIVKQGSKRIRKGMMHHKMMHHMN